jgi:uncharacterized membrane protein
MSAPDTPRGGAKRTAGVIGVGVVACAACCAGPVLGVLAAIGVASVVGYLLAGVAALVVGAAAAGWFILRRGARQRACVPQRVVPVEMPTTRPGG